MCFRLRPGLSPQINATNGFLFLIAPKIAPRTGPANTTNGFLFLIAPSIEPGNATNGFLFLIAPRIEPANATNGVLFWIGVGFAARTELHNCSLEVVLWLLSWIGLWDCSLVWSRDCYSNIALGIAPWFDPGHCCGDCSWPLLLALPFGLGRRLHWPLC